MKTVLKSLAIGITVFALSFGPALANMAQAGTINYEGIRAVNSGTQAKGLMFNFSFGGPKDYRPNSAIQDLYKSSLTKTEWVGVGAAALAIWVLILINEEDDDVCIPTTTSGDIAYSSVTESLVRRCLPVAVKPAQPRLTGF